MPAAITVANSQGSDASPVVWYEPDQHAGDPPWTPDRYADDPRPGHRAPDGYVDPWGDTLYDRIGGDLALLAFEGDVPAAVDGGPDVVAAFDAEAAWRGVPFTVVHLPDERARAVYGTAYVLVRPDQHVAWRGDRLPEGGAAAVLDVVLGVAVREAGAPVSEPAAAVESVGV